MLRKLWLFVFVGLAPMAFGQDSNVPLTPIAPAGSGTAQPAETAPKKPAKQASKTPLYDEEADAKSQIAAALKSAKKENRRVLIQWGFNSCHWCQLMHLTFKSDRALSKELNYEYDVVMIDAGINGKNLELAASYGAELEKSGFPYLTVLDADGKALANQETSSLEMKDDKGESVIGKGAGHDPEKLLAFLKAHRATPLNADTVFADASAKAKAEGKSVFLHFGAPWCSWCHRLDDWLSREDVSAAMGKDFVDLKIDQDRMTGGKELFRRFKKDEAGIPWFAIVNPATGTATSTSDGEKGNVGFPAAPEEIAHFMKMLEGSRKNMSEADIAALKRSLEKKN